ncbi:MAG: restriction endonuclease subunit M [Spirochaetaceae bacterium 4572_59]|nr:MAG: restriction endonuclease subunit M [Spirochaetaceae bacterium 4572_59]
MQQTPTNMANYIWQLADILRGNFKQSQYGRIILPFTLLRRLEGVLEKNKAAVLSQYDQLKDSIQKEEALEQILFRVNGKTAFYNISPMDLGKLGESGIKDNLEAYIQGFSRDAREIFEHFNFFDSIGKLNDANLLYKFVQKVRTTDLSPESVSNYEMGLIFEELIRKFAESSNETAGEHFTPRDIVNLTTSLVFIEDDSALSQPGTIRTIYDPTAGTGGFLSSGMEYVYKMNSQAAMKAFGQELNPESYAICKADMMIKGQDVSNIKLGNTLSGDQLSDMKFDYMLSNPPFGVDWKMIEQTVKDEQALRGYEGRFGPGLPRVSDGSLLFLMHLISKMRPGGENPSRIGIILNGSPLFTGGAGSGESEIRRYILEADLLEAIVALPNDMFYNTGIATYIWILTNQKSAERKGKVQLINGTKLFSKMRKSLGSKRNFMDNDFIREITRCFGDFEALDDPDYLSCKIFDSHQFGFRRITVERPLRESWQFSDERIESLRFPAGKYNSVMKSLFESYGESWTDAEDCELYGDLSEREEDIRIFIKAEYPELKEKQIKDVLDRKTWTDQKAVLLKARELQKALGTDQHNDMNGYDRTLKAIGIKLDAKEKKLITAAVSWKNPEAEKVIKKIHKGQANPLYGLFEVDGKVVEYKADGELRDNENIALDPSRTVNDVNEEYFDKEVLPHVPEAWIDGSKKDAKDGEIGIVGYEIPFNRHFYVYKPPRDLEEIDKELDEVSREIMELLREVHS